MTLDGVTLPHMPSSGRLLTEDHFRASWAFRCGMLLALPSRASTDGAAEYLKQLLGKLGPDQGQQLLSGVLKNQILTPLGELV